MPTLATRTKLSRRMNQLRMDREVINGLAHAIADLQQQHLKLLDKYSTRALRYEHDERRLYEATHETKVTPTQAAPPTESFESILAEMLEAELKKGGQ